MTNRLGRCTLLLWMLVVAGGLGPVDAQPAEDLHVSIEPDSFRAESGRAVAVERGTFRVPEHRGGASSDTIALSFVRFPSTAPDPGAPIVYLAGGPGGSATRAAKGDRFDLFMALRHVADVIAFDQRGTGRSHTLPRCPHGWHLPSDQPADRETLIDEVRKTARECAAFWRGKGVDLAGYTTVESAEDLDALRRALGAETLTLWGISYGTHLALAMMRRHPERVERAILAGVEGPDHTAKRPRDQQRLLETTDGLVRADSALRSKMPSLLRTIETVLDRVEADPVTTTFTDPDTGRRDTVVIGRYDLQLATAAMLRGPESFRALPQLYYDMRNGDFSGIAPEVDGWPRRGGLRAMPAAMDAASGVSDARRTQIARERTQTLLGDAINAPYVAQLAGALGVPDLGPTFRFPIHTDTPTFLISGTLDGRTPPGNAEEVRTGLPNSTHLLLDGAGHGGPLFLSSPRILEVMKTFLRGNPVEDEVVTLPLPSFPLHETIDVAPDTLARYAGTYRFAAGAPDSIQVTAAGNRLDVAFPAAVLSVHPTTPTTFFSKRRPSTTITFRVGADDRVMRMIIDTDGGRYDAVRVE